MTETVQLHIFQLVYTFICKRLVLMGKTVLFFFFHLNIYHHVCCLLFNLKSVLWGSLGFTSGCGGCPKGGDGVVGSEHTEGPWGPAGGAAASRTDVLHPFALSFWMWWGLVFSFVWGFFFFLLSFLSTHFVLFFLLLNLTCILSFCGVIYLVVDFLCYLVDLCWTNHA